MSRLAGRVCERNGITYSADELVDRIDCRTEAVLENVDDPDEAYRILSQRAGRAS